MEHTNRPFHNYAKGLNDKKSFFSQFSKAQFELKAFEALKAKPYYDKFIGLFYFCIFLAITAQGFSLVSEFGFFQNLIGVKVHYFYILIALTLLLVTSLEAAKYFLLNRLFASFFSISSSPLPLGLLLASVALCSLSIYGSVQGGAELAKTPEKIEQASLYLLDEVAVVRQEISDIKSVILGRVKRGYLKRKKRYYTRKKII